MQKFEWQDEYIALSVSGSAVPKVRAYSAGQEEHHKKKTFMEEYEAFGCQWFKGIDFGLKPEFRLFEINTHDLKVVAIINTILALL